MQRVLNIYTRSGHLVEEIHLAAKEVPVGDPKQCSCSQLQVKYAEPVRLLTCVSDT
jgi:hypothetical protein